MKIHLSSITFKKMFLISCLATNLVNKIFLFQTVHLKLYIYKYIQQSFWRMVCKVQWVLPKRIYIYFHSNLLSATQL